MIIDVTVWEKTSADSFMIPEVHVLEQILANNNTPEVIPAARFDAAKLEAFVEARSQLAVYYLTIEPFPHKYIVLADDGDTAFSVTGFSSLEFKQRYELESERVRKTYVAARATVAELLGLTVSSFVSGSVYHTQVLTEVELEALRDFPLPY